jgi:hypothetical protein
MAQQPLSGTQVSERGRHCLILSVGGAIWSIVAIVSGLHMAKSWLPVLVIVIIVGLLLAAGSLYVIRMAKRFPADVSHYQQMRGWYWRIVRIQYGAIILAVIIAIFNSPVALSLMLIIALINGLHFIALGPVLRQPYGAAYIKGILLCLLAIGTWLFVPTFATIGSIHVLLWWVIPGFGTTIILWADAIPALIGILRRLQAQKMAPSTLGDEQVNAH